MNLTFTSIARNDAVVTCLKNLTHEGRNKIIVVDFSETTAQQILARVDQIFSDVDGTLVELGHNTLSEKYITMLQTLSDSGVKTTLVTGKPLSEITRLVSSLPPSLSLRIIYEKGSYFLEPDQTGILKKHYLLSSPELEASIQNLKQASVAFIVEVETKYRDTSGQPLVKIGWGGDGTHESILSFDILKAGAPKNYLDIKGYEREALKVSDEKLLAQVTTDLREFITKQRPDWRFVDLGNGNIEVAPGPIEKDEAILSLPDFANYKGILLLGDSPNDSKMFELRRLENAWAGLVLHSPKTTSLCEHVDFVTFGMGNALPLLKTCIQSRK